MSENGPVLAIIVVNWNTRDLLAQCLESLATTLDLPASPLSTTVQVVDNVSTDGSAHMVQERFPWVQLVQNGQNVGFARANNQAMRHSTARYLLLLNPDTEVKPGAVQALVRFLDEHPRAGAVGPRLLNGDGSLQPSCEPAPTLFRELWRLFHLDRLHAVSEYPAATWELSEAHQVDVLKGACLLVRRDAVKQIGLFDEDYFMYSEEVDLCYRLRQAGWGLYWLPQAQVVHFGGQSTQQVAAQMFLQLYESKLLYFRKHHGRAATQAYKLILGGAALVRLSLSPLAWLEKVPQRERHLTLAENYLRLLRALPQL